MWQAAAAITIILVVLVGGGGGYETWAIRYDKMTITKFIKVHTHLAIVIALAMLALAILFGFVLGRGGA